MRVMVLRSVKFLSLFVIPFPSRLSYLCFFVLTRMILFLTHASTIMQAPALLLAPYAQANQNHGAPAGANGK